MAERVEAFRGAVTAAGLALAAAVLLLCPLPAALETAGLGLLVALLRERSVPLRGGVSLHLGFPVVFGALLHWGPGALLPVLLGGAAHDLRTGASKRLALLNAGADSLRVGAAGMVFRHLAGGPLPAPPDLPGLVAAAAALAVFLGLDLAIANGCAPARAYPLRMVVPDAWMAPLGALGASILQAWGAAPLVLLALPAAAWAGLYRTSLAEATEGRRLARLAEENRRLYREAHQTRKLASLGRLAAGVAHEINNPLLAIQTNLGLLRVADPDDRESVELMGEAVERCRSIVARLLDFARGAERARTVFPLRSAVEDALALLRGPLEGVRVEVEHAGEARVSGNLGELSQVAANLVLNARDAGGPIRVWTGERDGSAVLEVSDRGKGMEPEVLERIFEPFFTTKDVGEGTGLGLYLAYGTVRDHGGEIRVDSRPGEGTTVRVVLPLAT